MRAKKTLVGDLEEESYVSSHVEHLSSSIGCPRQTSASHSSTESEIISLDRGLLALGLGDAVIEVLRSTNNTKRPMKLVPKNWCGTGDPRNKTKT